MNMFQKHEEEAKNIYVDNESAQDKKSFKEKLEDFSDERAISSLITENSSRATFHIDDDILKQLNDLMEYIEATHSLDSKLNENLTVKQVKEMRQFARGFKSKFVGYALKSALEEWKLSEGLIPSMSKSRFKGSDGKHYRAFKFEQQGVLYLLVQNNRGVEQSFMSSETHSEDEINKKFDEYVEKEQKELEEKRAKKDK